MSFSSPQPTKSARTLQRTGSYISLSDLNQDSYSQRGGPTFYTDHHSYSRPSRGHKSQRDKRKSVVTQSCPDGSLTITFQRPSRPTTPKVTFPTERASSPLAPTRTPLPARTAFPKSKPQPDLYRTAITTCMRMSPEGQKILTMGPRLALSIYTATKELEQLVAAQRDSDGDVSMSGGEHMLSTSWVVVPQEDWEMVDCSA
jgi:hypothetical protein